MFFDFDDSERFSRPEAPEFPPALAWVNMREPPTLESLRGRVVLLYFWTHSNIHCIHALDDIKFLENKYRDELAVLGVHSPKFAQERVPASVMRAVNRHFLRHPVASDPEFVLWRDHEVASWPSYVVIDTAGRVAEKLSGEGRRSELESIILRLSQEQERHEALPPLQTTARPEPKTPLRFPGRVVASADKLYVADTGHNRVLECSHEGRILRQFGSGAKGFWDGRLGDAGYCEPMGLALAPNTLFVADRGNHAIRRVTLSNGETTTFVGTGAQGRARGDSTDLLNTPLSSPWEVSAFGSDRLFIGLAGQHQIGMVDLGKLSFSLFGGNGREDMIDGALLDASFAKPVGIAQHAQTVYVADASSSSIRAVKLFDRTVRTLAGKGLNEFGDSTGPTPADLALQHPSGIALDLQLAELWITDAFNGRIKVFALRGGASRVVAPDYRFHEPGGISLAAGAAWVANTNVHEIVRIDMRSGAVARVPVGE